jgi:hypothetical protein
MSMVKTDIIKRSYELSSGKKLPDQHETIEAADNDRLFGLFFREYDNRYKYCNHTNYVLADPSMREGYREWFSDIGNYADNGGDMW